MAIMRSRGAGARAAVDDLAHALDHRLVLPADALDAGVVDVLLLLAVDEVVVLAPRHEPLAAVPVVGVGQVFHVGRRPGIQSPFFSVCSGGVFFFQARL